MKREFEMDPSSDRYRICPNCETEFMALHRTRKFCEDWCRNEYHNANKRINQDSKIIKGSLEWNIQLFSGMDIPNEGIKLSLEELKVFGIDIRNYSSKVFLSAIEGGQIFLFKFSQFYLRRISENYFLLTQEIVKP